MLGKLNWAVMQGCGAYNQVNVSNTLEKQLFRDAVICSYAVEGGLTMPLFGAAVMLGVINVPMFIRQESAAIPVVLSLTLGGIFLTQVASIMQAIMVAAILFGIGLAPVLVLHRISR